MKRGQTITYIKKYNFGKESKITAKIVAILGREILLDNGDKFINYND